MEMHTPRSLYATHAIIAQPGPRTWSRWIRSFVAMCSRLRLALRRERKIRRAAAELESLSEHMLNDIGIRRGDIEHIVRGRRSQFWRRSGDARC
jgi:uncharacterized protein YjiS (DUF1127 family)